MQIAISWLCEEWYNEKVHAKSNGKIQTSSNYEIWTNRVLEGFSPYLDAKDEKYLIRFLSEIPELQQGIFDLVKRIANDPDRGGLAVKSLWYLAMFKPPAKEQALDAIADLYRNYQGASVHAEKALRKFRPGCLEDENKEKSSTPQVKLEQAKDTMSKPEESADMSQSQSNGHGSPTEDVQQDNKETSTTAEGQAVAAAG